MTKEHVTVIDHVIVAAMYVIVMVGLFIWHHVSSGSTVLYLTMLFPTAAGARRFVDWLDAWRRNAPVSDGTSPMIIAIFAFLMFGIGLWSRVDPPSTALFIVMFCFSAWGVKILVNKVELWRRGPPPPVKPPDADDDEGQGGLGA